MNATKSNACSRAMCSVPFLFLTFALALPAAEKPLADALVLWRKSATETDPKRTDVQMLPKEFAGKAISLSVKLRTPADAPASILGWKGQGNRSAVRLFSEFILARAGG